LDGGKKSVRTIAKGEEPRELLSWKQKNQDLPQNLNYRSGNFPYEAVRQALLLEQFHLCAYTMKSLKSSTRCKLEGQDTTYSCHIEHLLPQSRKIDSETIDFQNMFACFPPSRSDIACSYGAQIKKDFDPEKNSFLSPLNKTVELNFKFYRDGRIEGLTAEGKNTIDVLRLNHPSLKADRAAVIKGRLEPKTGKPLTAAAARRLAKEIREPDAYYCLTAFCIAIAQVALDHAEREERRSNRIRKEQA
jgi:uncharacterized protein (TIGR02646 family)